MTDELNALRAQMDAVNREILDAYLRRMRLSGAIARVKKNAGMPVADVRREREILDAMGSAAGTEFESYTRELFRLLMDQSRNYQLTLRED